MVKEILAFITAIAMLTASACSTTEAVQQTTSQSSQDTATSPVVKPADDNAMRDITTM